MIVSYSKGNSRLHRLHPLAKLSVVFAGCTALFLIRSIGFTVAVLAAIIALAAFAGAERVLGLARSRFAGFLTLWLILANAVFVPSGKVLVSIPLFFFQVPITAGGLLTGVVMALGFLTILLMSGLFVTTTDPAALVYSLMHRGIPYRYGFMLVLMLRVVPVFEREWRTIAAAQRMRGLEVERPGPRQLLRSIRYTLLPLIVSALSKVDVLTVSMEGRAFGCKPHRTFLAEDRYGLADKALIVASLLVVALLIGLLVYEVGWLHPIPSPGRPQ